MSIYVAYTKIKMYGNTFTPSHYTSVRVNVSYVGRMCVRVHMRFNSYVIECSFIARNVCHRHRHLLTVMQCFCYFSFCFCSVFIAHRALLVFVISSDLRSNGNCGTKPQPILIWFCYSIHKYWRISVRIKYNFLFIFFPLDFQSIV